MVLDRSIVNSLSTQGRVQGAWGHADHCRQVGVGVWVRGRKALLSWTTAATAAAVVVSSAPVAQPCGWALWDLTLVPHSLLPPLLAPIHTYACSGKDYAKTSGGTTIPLTQLVPLLPRIHFFVPRCPAWLLWLDRGSAGLPLARQIPGEGNSVVPS